MKNPFHECLPINQFIASILEIKFDDLSKVVSYTDNTVVQKHLHHHFQQQLTLAKCVDQHKFRVCPVGIGFVILSHDQKFLSHCPSLCLANLNMF